MEIQVGMPRANVMKDAGNCAPDARIETLDRIDVNGVPNVFAAGVLHGLMRGEALANGHERLRLVAHQTGMGFDLRFDSALCCTQRKTGDDRGTRVTGRRARRDAIRSLHHCHDRRLLRIRLTFPAASRRWIVWMLSGLPTEMEMVNLDRTIEHVLACRHET